MTDYLDVVPVGVKNERRIVLATVLRTQSRRSVRPTACANSGGIERVDLLPVLRYECNVSMRRLLIRLVQAQ
jgi:hypothetical protein